MGEIILLLAFEKDGLGMKKPKKIDMLLNNKTKTNQPPSLSPSLSQYI